MNRIYKLSLLLSTILLLSGCSILEPDTYYVDEGMERIENADYQGALENFSAAIEEDRHLVEAYRGQGLAYMGMKDFESAVSAFDRAVDLTSENQTDVRRDILLYKATALYQAEDYEGAVRVCDTVQSISGNVDSYYLRGLCYMELEQKDRAAMDFNTAVKLSPEDYDLLINIYECYSSKNLSAEGDTYLQQALSINSDDSGDSFQKARIYYYLEDYDRAKEELNEPVENGERNALLLMGRIYLKQNDTAHARQLYDQFLNRFGETAEVCNGIVLCDIAEEKYDQALKDIEEGLKLKGEEGIQELYFNEIVVYERKREFSIARSKAQAYVENYPTDQDGIREYEFLKTR